MAASKQYKLDLKTVLNAIDNKDMDFYSNLSDEEKKGYTPLVLMRYISSLTDQSKHAAYAVMATNDLVNIGFWNLTKHPELQHKLMCVAGLGSKQYRPWLDTKRGKKRVSKLDEWLLEQYPHLNTDELDLLKLSYDNKSWAAFVKSSGVTDSKAKELIDAWKK
jgi:hypothetical protein